MRIVVLSKRQYTNKDVIDDRYGRLWEIPMALAGQGHNVTCICLSYQKRHAGTEVFAAPGGHSIRWISVNAGVVGVIGFIKYFLRVRKTIRAERPDVVWSASDTIYTVLGRYFARRFACRFVADLYDNFEYFASYRVPVLRHKYRQAVREADGVSVVSEALRRHVEEHYQRAKPTALITNAVDPENFKPLDRNSCRAQFGLSNSDLLVGAAGDISNYRGADMLYKAFTQHATDLAGVKLIVAGFRDADTKAPAGENIVDLGSLPAADVPAFLSCLDVVVIYNRSSTFGDFCFPQKFYEALACKRPIVVARVGELKLLLEDKPQFFYEDGDVAGLVAALLRQLKNGATVDIPVPTWSDQARLLEQLMRTVLRND